MLPAHEQLLDDHKGVKPLVVEDKSLGTICCAVVPGSGPVLAMQRPRGGLLSNWAFPKGHPDAGESDENVQRTFAKRAATKKSAALQ
jgi:8-oxo-dGTP pyrophosphatase MutT (NUDIX family)